MFVQRDVSVQEYGFSLHNIGLYRETSAYKSTGFRYII